MYYVAGQMNDIKADHMYVMSKIHSNFEDVMNQQKFKFAKSKAWGCYVSNITTH